MSSAALHPELAELLDSRRLGSLAASRQRFTVSREEALLRLREQVRERGDERWDWTLLLVRAANALSELAEARVSVEASPEGEDLRVVAIDVIVPGTPLPALDLSDMLAGALEPDLGEPLHADPGGGELELRLRRFRMLIGRALNAALAYEPVALELLTPAGGRRFERREQLLQDRDPYVERKTARCEGESRFVVRVCEPQPGLSSRFGRWLRGRGEVGDELASLWRSQRLADHELDNVDEQGAVALGPALAQAPVELGGHALLGSLAWVAASEADDKPARAEGDALARLRASLYLVRDGILLVDLGPALREQQLDPVALAGFVDCPTLRLTADERSVVRDANFELLVAWLHDFLDRQQEAGSRPEARDSLGEGVRSASGHTITTDQLAEDARRGRELIYVWRHQAAMVPAYAKARVAALWPSEERVLRARFKDLRLVPLRALGAEGDVDPADLTALRAGSYEPLVLVKDSPIGGDESSGALAQVLRLSIDAYVHRARTATTGFIVILAYERRVAQIHERAQVFAGVTLVCRLRAEGPELDVAKLRRDSLALGKIVQLCRRRTQDHWEGLLAHVMSRAKAWENPFLRAALDELGPGTIGLRYVQSEDGVRLGWRDSVLLDVVVGRTIPIPIPSTGTGTGTGTEPDGGEPRTLRDGLRQLRAPGLILVAHPHKRHTRIQSADPRLRPWLLADDAARSLLVRVVGRAAVLDMPVVAEAHPLVVDDPLEDQRHLVRRRATVERDLDRSATDPLARQRLLGHLLVARGLDGDALGLDTVPLLDRYDPRALSPTRLVSLASVLSERPRPGLVPAGAVHRGLPRPMLEVVPGLAALLAEVEELEPGTTSAAAVARIEDEGPSERSTTAPVRRRARGVPPLLARAVVHPFVIGRLQVAGDASSEGIGLWARGLRVGELELAEPLGRVSGRMLLTPQGQRVGRAQVREVITKEARALLADALRQRTLLPPDGPQRRRLDHFVEYIRGVVRVEDRFGLADDLGLGTPADRGARVVALREMSLGAAPLRPLTDRREALLAEVVRQSLAMRVHFDTAMLSWRPAKLGKRRRDGSLELEFGLRNRWVQRGLDEGRELDAGEHRRAALLAGVLVVAAFFEQAREREDVELGAEHLVVALWRLLRLG
ncbi:hypothetical protein ENSA5_39390 [Enhygromyxa salina]|uniref:Uncharacterized protein n=1 Tax=Enhygromyxa salina TaxID=215803 RepID=A0A2S9XRI5_9BACT|nr:hypothetical protein [Enhygromyxa salina]PRP95474.1 hypothetical protein ENSA5_39390 [Enhygromyxa salina]